MSGWCVVEVTKGKNLKHTATEIEVGYSWCNGKQKSLSRGEFFNAKGCVKTKADTGTVKLTLHSKGLVNKMAMGGLKTELAVAEIPVRIGVGEEWVKLSNNEGSVLVSWRYTHFALGGMFAEEDETAQHYDPMPYSMKVLQGEIGKVSTHGYNMMLPYWWLNDRWFWTYPLESLLLFLLGCTVFYYNLFNVAFPATLLVIMSLNFLKKFRGLPIVPEVEALGWLKTFEWVSETLKWTQNILEMTNDSLDGFAEMFTWENQDTTMSIFISCIAAAITGYFGYLHWNYVWLVFWIYMFTYYPLGYLAPQLYKAIHPASYFQGGGGGSEEGKGSKNSAVLPIGRMTIPRQEKKPDGNTHYEVKLLLTSPEGEQDQSTWKRYSDFATLRSRLELIDKSIAVRGFPGKTAFAVKGEALNARRRDLEAWLATAIEQSKTSRGAAWRPPLREFLIPRE